jgi:hypothetical protein
MSVKGINFKISGTNNATPAMNSFNSSLQNIRRTTQRMAPIQASWNKGLNENRRAVQQLGFQVGDFATQIAGGQSAMLAFIQQGGQMLQFFGPFGSIMGAALAVFGSLGLAMYKSGVAASELTPILGVLRDELSWIVSLFSSIGSVFVSVANLVLNNLDTIVLALAILSGIYIAGVIKATILASNTFAAFIFALKMAGPAATGLMVVQSALLAVRSVLMTLLPYALIVLASVLIQKLMALADAAGGFGELWGVVSSVVNEAINRMKLYFQAWVAVVNANLFNLKASFIEWFSDILERNKDTVNSMIGAFAGAYSAVVAVWNALPAAFARIGALAMNFLVDAIQSGIGGVVSALNAVLDMAGMDLIAPPDLNGWKTDVPAAIDLAGAAMTAFGDAYGKDYVGSITDTADSVVESLRNQATGMEMMAGVLVGTADASTNAWQKFLDLWNKPENNVDITDWFSGSGTGDTGGGTGGGTSADSVEAEAKRIKQIYEDMSKAISGSLLSGFKAVVNGTKSLKDFALDSLNTILDKIQDVLLSPIFDAVGNSLSSMILGVIGAPTFSFAGGGFTGNGARSGGLDGKGGFGAILHPNETVIDHSMTRAASSTQAGGTITLNIIESESFASTVQVEADAAAVKVVRNYDRNQLPASVQRVTNNGRVK